MYQHFHFLSKLFTFLSKSKSQLSLSLILQLDPIRQQLVRTLSLSKSKHHFHFLIITLTALSQISLSYHHFLWPRHCEYTFTFSSMMMHHNFHFVALLSPSKYKFFTTAWLVPTASYSFLVLVDHRLQTFNVNLRILTQEKSVPTWRVRYFCDTLSTFSFIPVFPPQRFHREEVLDL